MVASPLLEVRFVPLMDTTSLHVLIPASDALLLPPTDTTARPSCIGVTLPMKGPRKRTAHTTAMIIFVPGPTPKTLILFLGSTDSSCCCSGSTNAPTGTMKRSTPIDLTSMSCASESTPCANSWSTTATIIPRRP